VNPTDAARIGTDRISWVGNAITLPASERLRQPAVAGRILMVGFYEHPPNASGLRWFAAHVLPTLASRFERVLKECSEAISYSLIGNVVISVIAGSVIFVAATIVGAPSPIVLAVIVGLFDLIPQVGSAIAAFIVCIITLIAEGWGPALALLAVILVYQQVENYMIQPAVMRQAVELSGFATIAVVMLGGALLGVVGAVLAVPVAASVKIVMREVTDGRRTRMAAMREEPAG